MRAYEEVRAAYMRVFDFDGTIYDGESLFDLYLFSARYDPKVLRYIAPVLRYAIKYKLGRATFDQMEYGVGKLCHGYLSELAESVEFEELVNAFWDRHGPPRLHGQRQQNPPSQIIRAEVRLPHADAKRSVRGDGPRPHLNKIREDAKSERRVVWSALESQQRSEKKLVL